MSQPDTSSCPSEWRGLRCESGAGHSGYHEVCIVWSDREADGAAPVLTPPTGPRSGQPEP